MSTPETKHEHAKHVLRTLEAVASMSVNQHDHIRVLAKDVVEIADYVTSCESRVQVAEAERDALNDKLNEWRSLYAAPNTSNSYKAP